MSTERQDLDYSIVHPVLRLSRRGNDREFCHGKVKLSRNKEIIIERSSLEDHENHMVSIQKSSNICIKTHNDLCCYRYNGHSTDDWFEVTVGVDKAIGLYPFTFSSRQNCRKSSVEECIFDQMALHIEHRFKKLTLLLLFSDFASWVVIQFFF